MAVNTSIPKLSEAELNNPDLDDAGVLNVESYPLLSGDEIEDPYLSEVWNEAVKLIRESPEDNER